MKSVLVGYDAVGRPIYLDPDEWKIHMHVIGSSGSGKSKFLENLMRELLRQKQGFCLIDPEGTLYRSILNYCAHYVLDREIIPMDLSDPSSIVGFNPFQPAADADLSVQVDARVKATMHAWNIPNTEQTPTLARTLWLIYMVMLEQKLGLSQVQHLIDFNAREIRSHLIDRLRSPLIQREWRELQSLQRAKDWREELLSAKNKLFKFLTSDSLMRFMGLPGFSINLQSIMDEGKILLVNLGPSDRLSDDNARAFGALLVNEFFEAARRRKEDEFGHDPKPYYMFIDEFQNFVSIDLVKMLDQVRKRGLYITLAHQRFGQLGDEDIADAVLTNCRIKAVFGGLPVQAARRMAEELFIGELDPLKIKVAIYQTKFWPVYSRDTVYGRSESHAEGIGSVESITSGAGIANVSGEFFQPGDWFGPQLSGTSNLLSSANSQTSGHGHSRSEMHADNTSEVDIPIFIPVPFQELSSIQYYTAEEQLLELTAALKEQFQRHCFIKIHKETTQPMAVPFVDRPFTPEENQKWYLDQQFVRSNALQADEVDRLIKFQEDVLLKEVAAARTLATEPQSAAILPSVKQQQKPKTPIWDQAGNAGLPNTEKQSTTSGVSSKRKRGPSPDIGNHARVAMIVKSYGAQWATDDNLREICELLDEQNVPVPETWATRKPPSRSWKRAFENYAEVVRK